MLIEEELKFYRILFENLILQHYLAYILTHFFFHSTQLSCFISYKHTNWPYNHVNTFKAQWLLTLSVLTLENPLSFCRVYLCVLYWVLKQTETML